MRRPGDPKYAPPPARRDEITKCLVDDRTALIDFQQKTDHIIPSSWWTCRLSNRDLPLADILAEARHELLHNRNFKVPAPDLRPMDHPYSRFVHQFLAVSYTHLTLPTTPYV